MIDVNDYRVPQPKSVCDFQPNISLRMPNQESTVATTQKLLNPTNTVIPPAMEIWTDPMDTFRV